MQQSTATGWTVQDFCENNSSTEPFLELKGHKTYLVTTSEVELDRKSDSDASGDLDFIKNRLCSRGSPVIILERVSENTSSHSPNEGQR